jgi:hypothetical protein
MDRMDLQFQALQTDRIKESMMNEMNAMEEYEADLCASSDTGYMNYIQPGFRVINSVG